MKQALHPDVYSPAPKRGGSGLYKLKTLARLLDMGEEWEDRLKACSEETTVPARALVCNAIKAAVEAIEASNYRVMLPMQFVLCSMHDDGLPAVNHEALEIEPGMRVRFTDRR
jgi:hypothetical protein